MRSKFIILAAIFCMVGLTVSAADAPKPEIFVATPSLDGHSKLPLMVKGDISNQVTDNISDWETALLAGAAYLCDMQADADTLVTTSDNANNGWDYDSLEVPDDPDDAGWDWRVNALTDPFHHTTAISSTNLYGPICLGLYDAYIYGGSSDTRLYRAMKDAADEMVANGLGYANNIIFLLKFGTLSGDSTYDNTARAMWDGKFVTGGGTHADATAYAEYIRDARAGQGYENGIIPWDIAAYVEAAQDLDGTFSGNGYDLDADAMAEVVYQDVYNDSPYGYFDLEEDKFEWWFNLGVGGVIDCFQVAGVHTGELPALLSLLLESQDPSGGFTDYYQLGLDWQTTGYNLMTLSRFGSDYRQQMGQADLAKRPTEIVQLPAALPQQQSRQQRIPLAPFGFGQIRHQPRPRPALHHLPVTQPRPAQRTPRFGRHVQ